MNKKILIIGLIIIVVTMSIGYAIYSTSLKVTGTGNIDSNFNIEVTGIKEDKKEGKAISITEPTYTKTSATFNTKLSREKDNIEYIVEITNKGSIDGKIENIEIINPNEQVLVETRGIEKGQILKAGEKLEYIVRVCIPEGTKIKEDITSKIEVFTEIIQDDKQIFNEPIDGIEANKLSIESTIEESDYTSIKATVKAKGNGLKYSYSLDDRNYTEATESNTHTFNNLNPNTRYTVYYKVEDKDGNYVTESKWVETRHDNKAPECTLEVKEITLDNIKIKATCTDETEIVKYELSESGGLYKDKGTTSEYNIDNFYLSKIKIRVTDLAGNNKEYKFTEEELKKSYSIIRGIISDKYKEIDDKTVDYENSFLDKTYPVGSVYISTSNENPADIMGGIWAPYGKGQALVGVDENDSNFNVVNKVGGTTTTTLAITNIPAHNHSIPILTGTAASTGAHTHSRGTMNITGVLNIRSYNGEYHDTIVGASGAFSKTVTNWSGTHDGLQRVTLNPGFYHSVNFDAKNSWTGVTTADGNHSHSITTNESLTGEIGSEMSFTNLQPFITVKMWRRVS